MSNPFSKPGLHNTSIKGKVADSMNKSVTGPRKGVLLEVVVIQFNLLSEELDLLKTSLQNSFH